jgi:hypothetical protein
MVKRFTPGNFRRKRSVAAIISKTMKRFLDKLKIPLYCNDIFISQL